MNERIMRKESLSEKAIETGNESHQHIQLTRQERRKQETRQRLYTATLSLFLEQGYDATTIDQIAERADVARGTVFNHFAQKEDFIVYWITVRRMNLLKQWQSEAFRSVDAAMQLTRYIEVLGRVNEEEREVTRMLITAWIGIGKYLEDTWLLEIFTASIQMGQEQGAFRRDIDSFEVASLLRSMYFETLYHWLKEDKQFLVPLTEVLLRKLDIVLHGVAL